MNQCQPKTDLFPLVLNTLANLISLNRHHSELELMFNLGFAYLSSIDKAFLRNSPQEIGEKGLNQMNVKVCN